VCVLVARVTCIDGHDGVALCPQLQLTPPTPQQKKSTTNPALLQWILGRQYPVIGTDFFFMALRDESKLRELQEHRRRVGLEDRVFFSIDNELLYFPFCADFGPLNFGCVFRFVQMLNEKLATYPKEGKSVVLVTTAKPETRTNAATLIGCYLVLEKGWTPEQAWAPFEFENACPFLTYRDASFDEETFHLLPIDILKGLYRAKQHNLIDLRNLDIELFDFLDDPNNADMHEVIRNKFIAFKGPKRETKFHEDIGLMDLAPEKYVDALRRLNASAVVRLNEPCYDKDDFVREGFNHYDIYFDDCSTPDETVLNKWFDACRAEKGALAVHCKAGLGRTGTLICAWLMRKYRFTGAEVIGFIRVMRPGSILGEQQEFLADNEEYLWSLGDPDLPPIHACGDCLVMPRDRAVWGGACVFGGFAGNRSRGGSFFLVVVAVGLAVAVGCSRACGGSPCSRACGSSFPSSGCGGFPCSRAVGSSPGVWTLAFVASSRSGRGNRSLQQVAGSGEFLDEIVYYTRYFAARVSCEWRSVGGVPASFHSILNPKP